MPNPCGGVHMPNMACRECDRIRKRDGDDLQRAALVTPISTGPEASERDRVSSSPDGDVAIGREADVAPTRIEVAREALTNADRQRRFRGKDPEGYKAANRERMRARRKK